MAKKRKKLLEFVNHEHNVTAADLVHKLTRPTHGEIARILGISAGHLSRIVSGERHATERHVEALKRLAREKGIL